MTEVAWKILGLALSASILLTTRFGLGMRMSTNHFRPQLEEKGAKLGELSNQAEQRQAKAAQAVSDTQQQAAQYYAAAQRLQQERAEGDPAAVAEALIDRELGL